MRFPWCRFDPFPDEGRGTLSIDGQRRQIYLREQLDGYSVYAHETRSAGGIDADLVADMKAGRELVALIERDGSNALLGGVSLMGFTRAYHAQLRACR